MKPDPLLLAKKINELKHVKHHDICKCQKQNIVIDIQHIFFTLLKIQDSIEAVRFFKI